MLRFKSILSKFIRQLNDTTGLTIEHHLFIGPKHSSSIRPLVYQELLLSVQRVVLAELCCIDKFLDSLNKTREFSPVLNNCCTILQCLVFFRKLVLHV